MRTLTTNSTRLAVQLRDAESKCESLSIELDHLRTQLKSVEAERDEAKRLLIESKDALHEVAAFGNCDCNIPKGVTCVPCECAMICNQIHTFLNPKPQDVK